MYKFNRNRQFSLSDFNQPIGLKMNPENRWIKEFPDLPLDVRVHYLPKKRSMLMRITPTASKSKEDSVL